MKAVFKHLLAKPNNRGHDSKDCASMNNLPARYGKSPVKTPVNQKYPSAILFLPSKTKPMVRRLIKPLGTSLLTLIFTAPQVVFEGNLRASNRVLAQTQTTSCPAGTTSTQLNWNTTNTDNNREAIENQQLNAGPVTATLEFTESAPGQVIDNQETSITSRDYGGQPGPNLEFNIGPQPPGAADDLPAPPNSNATLIINFSQPIQVEPLLLLDIDRDGVRDVGFTFQDQATVTALNGNTPVGVNLRAISPSNVRVQNNVATGINENAEPSQTQGNVEATITGAVTQIRIQYTAATESGPPRQDETIGLTRLNLCVPNTGPGSIGDTVFNDRNGDGVQNQDEPGIPNVTLTLTLPGPDNQLGTADDTTSTTTTNENGVYGFNNLPAGPYQVAVTPPENFPEITTGSQQINVELPAGENLDNVDFGLRAGPVGEGGETNLRLVKRITGVFRNGQPISENFNTFIEDPNDNDDNVFNRSAQTRPLGLTQFEVRSGDEVEYTIYFLGEGGTPLQNVRICDLVPPQTSFIPNAFGGSRGIRLQQANTDTTLSNNEDGDAGAFYSPLTPLADRPGGDGCQNQNNPDGAVIVNLGSVPPDNNFGLIRFRVRID